MNLKNQNTAQNTGCGNWNEYCWNIRGATNRPDKRADQTPSETYAQHVRVDRGKNDSASGYDSEFSEENHEKEVPIGSPNPGVQTFRAETSLSPNRAAHSAANREKNAAPEKAPDADSTDAPPQKNNRKFIFNLKKENFYFFIESSEKIMVEFWAPKNLASQNQSKILNSMLQNQDFDESVRFARVNLDANLKLAEEFGVEGAPATILFQNGRVAERFAGLTDARLLSDALNKKRA